MVEISLLSRAGAFFLESAEVVLAEFSSVGSGKTINGRGVQALRVLGVDGSCSSLGEGFGVEVFRFDLGDVACVSGDVLGLDVVVGAAEPVVSVL